MASRHNASSGTTIDGSALVALTAQQERVLRDIKRSLDEPIDAVSLSYAALFQRNGPRYRYRSPLRRDQAEKFLADCIDLVAQLSPPLVQNNLPHPSPDLRIVPPA